MTQQIAYSSSRERERERERERQREREQGCDQWCLFDVRGCIKLRLWVGSPIQPQGAPRRLSSGELLPYMRIICGSLPDVGAPGRAAHPSHTHTSHVHNS